MCVCVAGLLVLILVNARAELDNFELSLFTFSGLIYGLCPGPRRGQREKRAV